MLSESEHKKYRFLRGQTFALTWTAYASYYLCRKNLSVAKPALSEQLGLSNASLGDIDTGYLAAYAIGQFVSGLLGDKVGGKKLVGFGLIATAILNVVFGTGQTFAVFILAWTLNGFAQSTGWPGCAKAFSNWFARRERGTVMGLWATCYQVGGVVSTLLATMLLVEFGWSSAFFGPALFLAGFAVLFIALQKPSPEEIGLSSIEEYYRQIKGLGEEKADADDQQSMRVSAKESFGFVIRSRPIWTLGLTYVVLKFVRYSLLFWLPLYMAQHLKYDSEEAGYTSSVFEIAGIAGVVFAGLVSDRISKGRRAPVVVIMMLLLSVATYSYAEVSAMGRIPNIIGIALIGFLLYGPDSVTSGVAAVDFGDRRAAGFATGFVNGLGSIGAALSGVVVGRLSESYGWEAVFSLFAPLCLIGAVLMATMWNQTPKHEETA